MTGADCWKSGEISGFLLDITGVLYDSGPGDGQAIPGSVEAVQRLLSGDIPVRFVTNETTCTRQCLVDKLHRLGFTGIRPELVFPPAPAVVQILKQRQLRPFLLVAKEAEEDYVDLDTSQPNCVVIADAAERFSYENVNEAFQVLMSLDQPTFFSLGIGKYYKHDGNLQLDVGAYTRALEYATGATAEVVGKPSPVFFNSALLDMNLKPGNVVMVGDDIVNDVGGAINCGIHGVQVRTGKYRVEDEKHPTVTPDDIVDNLAQAVERFFAGKL